MNRIVFPGIAMIGVSYAFARFSFGMFLPDIAESLELTEAASGAISSLAYLAYCLALLTSSVFIYRTGAHTVVQMAGFCAVVGMIGIAIAPNLYVLTFGVLVAGLSSGWASPALSQVAVSNLQPSDRDRGNTWINTGTSFGLILSGPIVLLFTEHWRLSYSLFALIGIGVMLWNWKSVPKGESRKNEKPVFGYKLFNQWKKSGYLLIASFLVGTSSSIYWTFSRSYLTAEYDMSYLESVAFWIMMGISGILGGIAGGSIKKFGLTVAYRFTLVIMAFSIALITVHSVPMIYISGILFGIAYIFMTGIFIVWGTRLFIHNPSVAVSLSFLFLGIGQSLGSFIAGGIIEIVSYAAGFLLFAGIGLVGLVLPIKTNDMKDKSDQDKILPTG
ncbi:MFS transporter [Pseudogracilibacillus auburnensis]|uniref:Putative MFS family arabinose efflux permease n=1 Tax=Pseudogracilibacillus auburnensis TaxID=1494959 RepID=A0A2V3WBH6_9BACI|nr:MFS transporter [Pseudogracilibacillus auburnensis]MBO1001126.1 MFS transporter [Pseudogracilibacillus auburnensis]PXW90558.1 putative MFS family arabinose efflux permease [Pseudogracilibacillus auburnensis]